MKKTLIALAVLGAFPALAQAQTSVQLTGSLDVAVESLNEDANGGQDSDLKVSDGIWGGSRVNIIGSEDLGSGTRAVFNLEFRNNVDTGERDADSPFYQQAWVGLEGGFGGIRLGRHDTPLQLALDGTGDTTAGSWYYNGDGLAGLTGTRNNALIYTTPTLGGLTLHAMYSAGEETEPAGAPDLSKLNDFYGASAKGEWGGLQFGLGYQVTDGADIANIKNTAEMGAAIGGQIGSFGAGVGYAQTEVKPVTGETAKTRGMSASLSYQFTDSGTGYLSYRREDPDGDDNLNSGVGIAYAHGLSKRTFVYAAAGIGKEEQGAGAEDLKPRRFALGVRHFF